MKAVNGGVGMKGGDGGKDFQHFDAIIGGGGRSRSSGRMVGVDPFIGL